MPTLRLPARDSQSTDSREGATLASLIIKNGRVIDGTGAPAFNADLAVDGDRIFRIAPAIEDCAEAVIDADGLVVAPGFIDIHAHGGTGILNAPTADSKVHDGVTTEVVGNCGSSAFPARDGSKGYRSAADFFEAVERVGSSINRASLVGLGAIRAFVVGPEARPADAVELARMREEAARALDEGAFGVSSGLIYPPGCFATREEIAHVAGAAGECGALYATHMRSEGLEIEAAIEEAEFVARASGARLQISHVKLAWMQNWQKIEWLDNRLHGMLDAGLDLACDRYPYTAASTNIGAILPNWVYDGSDEQCKARLRDPDTRSRIAEEVLALHPEPEYWDRVTIATIPEGGDPAFNGKTLRQVAEMRGEQPIDAVMNLLIECREKPGAIFFSMIEENLRRILSWPFVAIGSDARARSLLIGSLNDKPHPRAYGTFSRVLGRYVREEKLLTLEEAVRRMTSLPAERLGLRDRGALREGACADIAVFDPTMVADRATFADPHQISAGIPHVIVNGVAVIRDGKHTGALPGRMLRREC